MRKKCISMCSRKVGDRETISMCLRAKIALVACCVFSSSVGNRFVVVLGWHHLSSKTDADDVEQQHDPRNRAENPTLVQLPANKEAVVVVEEESL